MLSAQFGAGQGKAGTFVRQLSKIIQPAESFFNRP